MQNFAIFLRGQNCPFLKRGKLSSENNPLAITFFTNVIIDSGAGSERLQ